MLYVCICLLHIVSRNSKKRLLRSLCAPTQGFTSGQRRPLKLSFALSLTQLLSSLMLKFCQFSGTIPRTASVHCHQCPARDWQKFTVCQVFWCNLIKHRSQLSNFDRHCCYYFIQISSIQISK